MTPSTAFNIARNLHLRIEALTTLIHPTPHYLTTPEIRTIHSALTQAHEDAHDLIDFFDTVLNDTLQKEGHQ